MTLSTRQIYLIGFIGIALLLSFSFYLELLQGMVPCPLCQFQRLTLIILGVLFLLGSLVKPSKWAHGILGLLNSVVADLGIVLAGRQVWLQHYPNSDPGECAASLQYMMEVFPLNEVISKVFNGSAECAQKGAALWGFSLAEWSLVGFVVLSGLSLYQLFRSLRGL